jgi:hypothetical protein
MAEKNNNRNRGGQPGNTNAEKWEEKDALKLGNELIDWMLNGDENKFLKQEFLLRRGLYAGVISHLCKKFESFSKLIKRADEIQLMLLDKYGLAGKIDKTMTIFIEKNCHNRKDKQDLEVESNNALSRELAKEIEESGGIAGLFKKLK